MIGCVIERVIERVIGRVLVGVLVGVLGYIRSYITSKPEQGSAKTANIYTRVLLCVVCCVLVGDRTCDRMC